jgi:hypothetical protein
MQVIWELAERNNLKKIKNRIGKYRLGHLAAYGREQDVMQKIWDCARELLTTKRYIYIYIMNFCRRSKVKHPLSRGSKFSNLLFQNF